MPGAADHRMPAAMRVLIDDGSPDAALWLAALLQSWGYEVVIGESHRRRAGADTALVVAARRLHPEPLRQEQRHVPAPDRRRLSGCLPICAYCKSIRDDANEWRSIEDYIAERAPVQFSHGVCPGCVAVARAAMDAVLKS